VGLCLGPVGRGWPGHPGGLRADAAPRGSSHRPPACQGCAQRFVSTLGISGSDVWLLAPARRRQGMKELLNVGWVLPAQDQRLLLTCLSPPSSLRPLLPLNWEKHRGSSLLRKTARPRAGSFLGLLFSFVSWSRRDMGLVTWALQVLWCCCRGRPAAPRALPSPAPAWQRSPWPPEWSLDARPQSRTPASGAAALGRGMELEGSWPHPAQGLIPAAGRRGGVPRGISGLEALQALSRGQQQPRERCPRQDPAPVPQPSAGWIPRAPARGERGGNAGERSWSLLPAARSVPTKEGELTPLFPAGAGEPLARLLCPASVPPAGVAWPLLPRGDASGPDHAAPCGFRGCG